MGQPVVHFGIIGTNPEGLRGYYRALFGWEFDASNTVSATVSEPTNYGFMDLDTTTGGVGIPGGVGGGPSYEARASFYVGVADVEAALRQAESLGGTRRMGPARRRQDSSSAISATPKAT